MKKRAKAEGPDVAAPAGCSSGRRSTPRQREPALSDRCEVCDCQVPLGEQGWQQHAQGIRHRRNALSLKVHGERGHAVVSVFEPATLPGSYHTRDPAFAGTPGAGPSGRGPRGGDAGGSRARGVRHGGGAGSDLERLQRATLAELAMVAGRGLCAKAAPRFDLTQLEGAWAHVTSELARLDAPPGKHCRVCNTARLLGAQQPPAAPGAPHSSLAEVVGVALPGFMAELEWVNASGCTHHVQWNVPRTPATGHASTTIAALAAALQTQPRLAECRTLWVQVPCFTAGPAAAAMAAACCSLGRALGRHARVEGVRLSVSAHDWLEALEQGATGLEEAQRLWGHVLGALRFAVQVNAGIRTVVLNLPPMTAPALQLQQLQAAMLEGPRLQRRALLAGLHPRAGARCPLRRLPTDVAARIIRAAVPDGPPRRFILKLQRPIDTGGGDTNSSSSSGGSSDLGGYGSSSSSSSSSIEEDSGDDDEGSSSTTSDLNDHFTSGGDSSGSSSDSDSDSSGGGGGSSSSSGEDGDAGDAAAAHPRANRQQAVQGAAPHAWAHLPLDVRAAAAAAHGGPPAASAARRWRGRPPRKR